MFARRGSFYAVVLLLGTQASAGTTTTLDLLVGGGTLTSDDGKLVFSDFAYTPVFNAPAPSNIAVMTLENGLRFGSPLFSISYVIDYLIQYTVTGVGVQIYGVQMQSTGSATGSGFAGVFKVAEDGDNAGLANLTNAFGANTTMGTAFATFQPQSVVLVRDDVFVIPGNRGTGGLSDIKQTFYTTPTAIPSPTAAFAGLALLGVTGMRRRRSGNAQ